MTTGRRRRSKSQDQSSADTDYRSELWRMADALRGSMDAAEYKHVVLGLIFLKYISDAFEERRAQVLADWGGDRLRDDRRWAYGAPPVGNANFAWVQHFLHHLAPRGVAGFVLANGSMSSGQSGEGETDAFADVPGFCKSATLEDIRKHGHVLTPGRYVGAAPREDDGEPFADKMARLSAQWREQQAEARRLDAEIEANLERLGFGDVER